ncbi:MAG TPA: MFS transporter [Acetobacteraceae bacterium]|nr:MFS transporter [Acetobacteraceae bacterium]
MASRRAELGLDAVNFFAAAVQTGFGPFIAVYLTLHHWTGLAIGAILSLGTIVAMASQIPAGALVDAMANKRLAGAVGLTAIGFSALLLAALPTQFGVGVAEILHGFASCMVNPAIAAITLMVVRRDLLGERLGRNMRFASLGNGVAAAIMGAAGFWLSGVSVFILTALLVIPAIFSLASIETKTASASQAAPVHRPTFQELRALFLDRRLLSFMACQALFQMADAAMLPYVGRKIAAEAGQSANPLIAVALVLPQIVVALLSPAVGRAAESRGRRIVLMVGFASEPIRGLLFAIISPAVPLVLVQALDGIGAAVIGVLLPLIAADISRERGHFNLAMGAIGVAVGAGAAASTALAGTIDQFYGNDSALFALAGIGLLATAAVWLLMPESRVAPDAV